MIKVNGLIKKSYLEIFLFFFEASRYYCDEQRRRFEGSVQLQLDRQDGDPVVRLAGRRRSLSGSAGDHGGFKSKRHYADHGQVIKKPSSLFLISSLNHIKIVIVV